MKSEKQLKRLFLGGLALTLVLVSLPVLHFLLYHQLSGAPKAVTGEIDLTGLSPEDGTIYLDGEWEFYWQSFIASFPDDSGAPDLLMDVPDDWSKYSVDGHQLTAAGFGSYRLVITELGDDSEITVFIPDFGGAYRIFFDGVLVSESGTISQNLEEVVTVPKSELYPYALSGTGRHEIVIEVATTRFSGLYMTPILVDYHQAVRQNDSRNTLLRILFGVALFSFFSLLAMFLTTIRRKLYSFWMPVMIFFVLLRIMLTSEFYSVWQSFLFFDLSYESTNELMYLSTLVLKFLMIFLIQEQCGIAFSKKEKWGFLIYYAILYLIYLLVPKEIYNSYLSVLIPTLSYVLDFYLGFKVYRGWHTLKRFGLIVFFGTILVIAGLTLDSFYINGKILINMSLMLPLCLTLFSMVVSWTYARRTGDLQDDFMETAFRLELMNGQIAMQKEYYDVLSNRMNEIREIKHDFRHFLGVMDRLTQDENLIDLKKFLAEYTQKTEMEQLPIFCENAVANSIIGYYYLQAQKNGIHFESDAAIGEQHPMSDSDLCLVIGNALENAVEACRSMNPEKTRYLILMTSTAPGLYLLKVSNSFGGQTKMVEGQLVSTKEGPGHGLGLRNITKIVERYGGYLKIEHDDFEFRLMVAIPEKPLQ